MIKFIQRLKKLCWTGGNCDDTSMILWDEATPWDGPTEWS